MGKKYIITTLAITLVLFIGGIALLLNSISIGQNAGYKAMQTNGGSMETQRYNSIIDQTTENYRFTGAIIAFVGGIGVLLSGCGIYREMTSNK